MVCLACVHAGGRRERKEKERCQRGLEEGPVLVFVWMLGLIACILCFLWSECNIEMLLLIDTKVWCCAVSNRAVRGPSKPHFPDLPARSFVLTATNGA